MPNYEEPNRGKIDGILEPDAPEGEFKLEPPEALDLVSIELATSTKRTLFEHVYGWTKTLSAVLRLWRELF